MRIIIDMQGAQSTGSRNRGIGRYSLALAHGIVRNRGDHEVILALNGLFPDTISAIRQEFSGELPQSHIRVWFAPGPVHSLIEGNEARGAIADRIRSEFLASLEPDCVLITSLFEGLGDDAVTTVQNKNTGYAVFSVLYDLIPLIHREIYLSNPVVAQWYDEKILNLRRAKHLLSISESSRQEAIQYLGFDKSHVTNISTASDPMFRATPLEVGQAEEVRRRLGLNRELVMYTGGIDYRKNIEKLIEAYSTLGNTLRENHQLAIVCSVQAPERERLLNIARDFGLDDDEVVLTGYISDSDLHVLYRTAKLFVFPSWHEGFGLPILEAMSCGCPAIGSDCSSIPEVLGHPRALFDPKNPRSIAKKMKEALTDDGWREELRAHALVQSQKFSWDHSSQVAIRAMETEVSSRTTQTGSGPKKARLAYVSPLPPLKSGISDYSAELLPALSQLYDIDVVVAQDAVTDDWITAHLPIRSVSWFRENSARFDRVLYHFGNSEFHKHMFSLLTEIPGVVILHDFFLSGIVAQAEQIGTIPGNWVRELQRSHGFKAVHDRVSHSECDPTIIKYPCSSTVAGDALGVIVHSQHSQNLAVEWYGTSCREWEVVPLPRRKVEVTPELRAHARSRLGIPQDAFVVSSFGMVWPTKLSDRILRAWASSKLVSSKSCRLYLVGQNHPGEFGDEIQVLAKKGQGRAVVTGWVSPETYVDYLLASDVGIQLRTQSRGETSAAVLDCMNYGLATIVNAHGSMADLSETLVVKLDDEFETADLSRALERLWKDTAFRSSLGTESARNIHTKHSPEECSKQYLLAIESYYQNPMNRCGKVATQLAPLCTSLDDPTLEQLAWSLDRTFQLRPYLSKVCVDITALLGHVTSGTLDANGFRVQIERIAADSKLLPRLDFVRWEHSTRTLVRANGLALAAIGGDGSLLPEEPVWLSPEDMFWGSGDLPDWAASMVLASGAATSVDRRLT